MVRLFVKKDVKNKTAYIIICALMTVSGVINLMFEFSLADIFLGGN